MATSEGHASAQQPIRLLWLIDSFAMGGAESLVLPFIRGIDRSGFDLTVCCLNTVAGNPLEGEVRAAGVPLVNLGARNLRDTAAFRRLLDVIRSSHVDLIHSHLTYAALWGAIASRLTGVPMLATLHVAPPLGLTRETVRDRMLRFALARWADSVIAVSGALRRRYLAGGGLDPSRMIVVHNGIDIAPFQIDRPSARERMVREANLAPDAKIAVTVSVLRPGKGIDVLIDAIPHVAEDVVFLVVGDGPMREAWEARADGAGVAGRMRWLGFRRDIPQILSGCDLFVLPTLEDAFPTVLLEAMAASLPIVATAVGGIPEIVASGETGTLVPAGDSAALAAAVSGLLRDDGLRAQMGGRGRSVVEERFSTEQWIGRLSLVYRQTVLRAEPAA